MNEEINEDVLKAIEEESITLTAEQEEEFSNGKGDDNE